MLLGKPLLSAAGPSASASFRLLAVATCRSLGGHTRPLHVPPPACLSSDDSGANPVPPPVARQQQQQQPHEGERHGAWADQRPVTPQCAADTTLTTAQGEEEHATHDEGEDEPPVGEDRGGGVPGPMLPDNDPAHPPYPSPTSSQAGLPPPVAKPLLMTSSQARRALWQDGFPVAGVYITTILTGVGIVAASIAGSTPDTMSRLGGALPVATMVSSLSADADHPLRLQASLRAAVGAAAARAAEQQKHTAQVQSPSSSVPGSLNGYTPLPAPPATVEVSRPLVQPEVQDIMKKPELLPPAQPPLMKTPEVIAPPGGDGSESAAGKCEGKCGQPGCSCGEGDGEEEAVPGIDMEQPHLGLKKSPVVPAQPIPSSPQSLNAPQVQTIQHG